jgi:NAD(P)-dependent dehydrogenase (short-subunit alcohol dehydrogenase family)
MRTEVGSPVAIVTGAGGLLGRAIASTLATEGARVAVVEHDAATGAETLQAIQAKGGTGMLCVGDVSSPTDVSTMVAGVHETYGRVDVLVNNAAVTHHTAAFLDLTLEGWNQMLAVNLTGVFLCSQPVARIMREQGNGRIINITSVGALLPLPLASHYGASKGGVISLTKAMALELAEYNIQVNAIAPGAIHPVGGLQHITEELRDSITPLSRIPANRYGEPQDIAAMVAFLSSEAATYITGSVLAVDGGYLLL